MLTTYIWIARPLFSQDRARRNAQRAARICAQRRQEREQVLDYLQKDPSPA